MSELTDRVQAWIERDPDPDTRAELERLVAAGDVPALAERFDERLTFGTAGIRGPLGAGPARMNRVLVRQVTAGLAARLAADGDPRGRVVVIGHDARRCSDVFARDVAAVLGLAGFRVLAFDELVPTPLVAFATRRLGAAAGVTITASHNPPADNGYKVYWAGGAQIVAPLDAEIAAAIDAADPVVDLGAAPRPEPVAPDVREDYAEAVLRLTHGGGSRGLRIVYTPLHGVAGAHVLDLLARTGFTEVHPVAEQLQPDGSFPTVAFPNPEVPGALDLAAALAEQVDADLVLANDPDGDRIAVAVPASHPDRAGDHGVSAHLRVLTGDEVGCLLADAALRDGLGPDDPGGAGGPRLVATTVVSSQLLARIADDHGARIAVTLTGFKWLARAVDEAAEQGVRPVIAYEQALGVMLGDVVRDKDGISAAVVVADLAARLAADGRTLLDALDDLARRHGLHLTTGRSLVLDDADPGRSARTVERLRADAPERVGGAAVVRVDDYVDGRSRTSDGVRTTLDLPSTPLVGLLMEDGTRLLVRPSGTEPLLKCYVEVVEPVAVSVADARARASVRLEAMADALLALVERLGER